jgi:transcriptional regulator with XRE-family HTH domain
MPVSLEVARANFSAFVKRALREARDRGLTDDAIAAETGVGDSTFHRWAKGEWVQRPKLDKVVAFCVGLNLNQAEALRALGLEDGRPAPTEPVTIPEVDAIARMLKDPAVPDDEKQAVLHTLRMLARVQRRAQT